MPVDLQWPSILLSVLLAGCLIGLAIELLRAARRTPGASSPRPLRDRRLPDQRVELAAVPGVGSDPNVHDPRFRRFTRLDQATPVSSRPAGSAAPALLGKVVVFSLFLGRFGRAWSDAEIAQVHSSLWRVGVWLERQAVRWSAALNVAIGDTYWVVDDEREDAVEVAFVPEGDHSAPLEEGAVAKALVHFSRAAAQLGFVDAADLIGQMSQRVEADCWVWLLHPRCAGRSLAVPETDTPWPGVTVAVCYAREASFPEPLTRAPYADPVTYAHELLHLFGATDKYQFPLDQFPPGSLSDRDIMRLEYESLSQLGVDRATAREIGWLSASGA